jgi:hypothetical protein
MVQSPWKARTTADLPAQRPNGGDEEDRTARAKQKNISAFYLGEEG